MNIDNLFFLLLFSFMFFVILILLSNSSKPYFMTIKNSSLGIISLLIVCALQNFIGLTINLNFFTASISCILGLPGTFLLLIVNKF